MNPYFPGSFGGPQNPFAGGGAPDGILLQQMAQGFAPVMSMPQRQMRTGFENLPGFSSPGLTGLAMNMFVAPHLQQQMSNFGMLPGGLASQNVLDQMQVRRFQSEQQEMMSRIAQDYTPQGVTSTLRGMAALAGSEFDAPQQAAAARLGSTMATAAPLLAQMYPSQLDALAGRTGSAVVMAQRMSEVNRFRSDPVTGLTGFGAESSEQLARDVFDRLYTPENMSNMRGIRAGDVGDLYGQLTARGMIAGDPRNRVQRFQEAIDFASQDDFARERIRDTLREAGGPMPVDASGNIDLRQATQDQMDALHSDRDVGTQLRAFESDRVSSSIKGYVDVVSSMREIFGDFGKSDAPMAELIQGLEALSQGGLSQVSPGQLNQMVRTTSQLAQTSGMTLDAAFAMQQQASQGLEARGLNRVMSSQMTQGAMGFGQAMSATGANATPAFGLGSSDELRQLDQNLRVSAAASPMANAFGAILRARDELGAFDEGSEAEALSQALMTGQGQYVHNGRVVDIGEMDPNKIAGLMAAGNSVMNLADARGFITNRKANQEQIFENNLGNLVREEVQPDRVRSNVLSDPTRLAARNFLRRVDGFEDTATRDAASRDIGDAVDIALANMTDADRRDPERRRQVMEMAIKSAVPQLSDEQARFLAVDSFNEIQRRAEQDYGAHGSFENLMTVMNERTLEQGQNVRVRESLNAGIKNDLAGLAGSGGVMERAIAAIQKAGEGGEEAALGKVLAEAFGGIAAEDIQDQMGKSFTAVVAQQKAVESNLAAFLDIDPNDPQQTKAKADASRALEESRQSLRNNVANLRRDMESNGLLDQQARLDVTDVREFRESAQITSANRADLMMKLRGSSRDPLSTKVGQNLLAAEAIGLAPGDREVLAQMRAEAESTLEGTELDDALAALDPGDLENTLSDEQKNRIIASRQDRIDTRPTKPEVTDYLNRQGIKGDDAKDRGARALATSLVSARKRFVQSNMDRDDEAFENLGDVTSEEISKFAMEAGFEGDLTEEMTADIEAAILQERFADAEILRQAGTSRGAREQSDRFNLFEQTGVAASLRAGEQEKMDRTRTLVNDALQDPNFFRRTGGRGIAATRMIRGNMEEMTRLATTFAGGDLARLTTGALDLEDATVRRRLGTLAADRADELFKNGALLKEFAVGDLAGKSRKEIMDSNELSALLGNVVLQRDVQGIRESLDSNATFLEDTARNRGLGGLVTPGGAIKKLMGIAGGDDLQGGEVDTAKRAQAFETARLTLGFDGTAEDAFNLAMAGVKGRSGTGTEISLTDEQQQRVTDLGNAISLVSEFDSEDVNKAQRLRTAQDQDSGNQNAIVEALTRSGFEKGAAKTKAAELMSLKGKEFADALGKLKTKDGAPIEREGLLISQEKTRNAKNRQDEIAEARESLKQKFPGEKVDELLNAYDLVADETGRLSDEETKRAGLDPGGALGRLASAFGMGAESEERLDLQREAGAFAAGGKGMDLANAISRSAESLSGFKGANLKELRQAFDEGTLNEKLEGKSDFEKSKIRRGFSVLSSTGMLDAFMETDVSEKQKMMAAQFKSLQETGMSLDDVREKRMELTGKLRIEGDIGQLSDTTGDVN